MHKFFAILAAAAAFIPASALLASDRAPQHRFVHHGLTYSYTVTPATRGRQIIQGRTQPDGSAFRLVVDGDRVEGLSGGQPVSFRTTDGRIAAR